MTFGWRRVVAACAACAVAAWVHAAETQGNKRTETGPGAVSVPVGVEDDWPPFAWVPSKGAPVQGFAVELVRQVFQEAGVSVDLRPMPFARCMHEARTGVLVACFNSLKSAETQDDYLWHSTPMFREPLAIFARNGDIKDRPVSRADLQGRRVGYHHAYHYPDWFTGDAGIVRMPAGNDIALLQMLRRGRVDFVLFGASAGAWHLQAERSLADGRIRKVGEETSNDGFWMAFSKKHPQAPDVLQRFDQALLKFQAGERYRALRRQSLPGASAEP